MEKSSFFDVRSPTACLPRRRLRAGDGRLGVIEGVDLAIDRQLAHPPGDQLGELAAVVEDEDGLAVHRISSPAGSWALPG